MIRFDVLKDFYKHFTRSALKVSILWFYMFKPIITASLLTKSLSTIRQIRSMKIKFENENVIKGMKKLDRSLFICKCTVPALKINKTHTSQVKQLFKSYVLDINKKFTELDESDSQSKSHKYLLLDPDLVKKSESSKVEIDKLIDENSFNKLKNTFGFNQNEDYVELNVELGYNDFNFEDIMKAILPNELINENITVKGFSIVGHVAHFNLRDQLLDYKYIIGEVLMDKLKAIKTVVNKVNEIDNTYRNFKLEILAGENNTMVTCKENLCNFKFDFANVYWNSRLSTEHERIINLLHEYDIVYDVMAGVGPFSIPAATKKRCIVLANDLNPHSYKYLCENYEPNLNKKQKQSKFSIGKEFEYFKSFNLDGNEFIRTHLKEHLLKFINYCVKNENNVLENQFKSTKIYVLMNLPAMSIEFLPAFNNLFNQTETNSVLEQLANHQNLTNKFEMNVIFYYFCRNENEIEDIVKRVKTQIFKGLSSDVSHRFVRKVAPSKEMFCFTIVLPLNMILYRKNEEQDDSQQTPSKKLKTEDENK